MPNSFLEVGLEAGRRWQELNSGERPWIRIGTALCGEAAGAFGIMRNLSALLRDTASHGRTPKASKTWSWMVRRAPSPSGLM